MHTLLYLSIKIVSSVLHVTQWCVLSKNKNCRNYQNVFLQRSLLNEFNLFVNLPTLICDS